MSLRRIVDFDRGVVVNARAEATAFFRKLAAKIEENP
jgi:hypothetical protein